jgi:acetyl/propionyl-CoA carboxylase alpha subunit/acetyl-CoA carboxylase carboxyltransferase component
MADTPVYQDATERPERNILASAQPGSSAPLNESAKGTSQHAAVSRPEGFIERQFERIAIVNRGEAAMRLIRAVRELNREEHGRLTTVALFTEADRRAMFVHEADDAVSLGPTTFIDVADSRRKSSYLDQERIERALVVAGVDAAWVGWGLLSEEPWFAELCQRLGIVFIGPDADVLRLFRDKISTKRLAQRVGIPVVPWSEQSVGTLEEAQQQADKLGYPLLVKTALGTHGEGMQRVDAPDELAGAFASASAEAQATSGDATVFLERAIDGAHLVEVQIIADNVGTTWALGVRDCTVQRHSQKIFEESSSPVLFEEQEQEIRAAAIRLCDEVGYRNVGTVEFLYDPDSREFWFLEVNPCLDVEHPVTEATTGLDLVKLQLNIARGQHLTGEQPAVNGHAVEVRLYAEDPDNGFAPGPGTLDLFRLASGPGLRIDTGYTEGDVIAPDFHLMLAKIIAWGRDRQEALARLNRALAESAVVVRGGMNNKAFLLDFLGHPELDYGNIDTRWLDRLAEAKDARPRQYADVALLQAAIGAYNAEGQVEQAQFYTSSARGRPRTRPGIGITLDFHYLGHRHSFTVARLGPQQYRVSADGKRIDVRAEQVGTFESRVTCFGQRHRVLSVSNGPHYLVEVDGISHHITRDEGGIVRAPGPAVVVAIAVAAGDRVSVGDRLVVVEAMKMEMAITAPFAGRVSRLYVGNNVQVDAEAPLVQLEPLKQDEEAVISENVHFEAAIAQIAEAPEKRRDQVLEALRYQMLGYDVDQAEAKRLVGELNEIYKVLPVDEKELQRGEDEILSIFADISALFRRTLDPAEAEAQDIQVHSAEQDLRTYLRSRDSRQERLSEQFLSRLRRALVHYGVEGLDSSPELDAALLMIYKAHQHDTQQLAAIIAILERRLAHADMLAAASDESLHELLDRLLIATQGRYPTISDLANEVRFSYFDEPLLEQVRAKVYEEMEAHLTYLAAHPETDSRLARIDALVTCPQPLQALLTSRFPTANDMMQRLMLEVLTRRYYRIRLLQEVETTVVDGQAFATASYDFEGARIHVVTTFTDYGQLEGALSALARFTTSLPSDHDVVADIYAWHPDALGDAEAMEEEIRGKINKTSFPRPLRRIVVAAISSQHGVSTSDMNHFTYRQKEGEYQESQLYRGLHPMMGKRLNIWRLSNFNIKRLPSVEDVYLFHGVARDNPKDERLFAIAEVRDVTREVTSQGVQIPHLERMFLEALAGIRLFQSRRPAHQRLPWNRVILYVWSPLQASPEEIEELMSKLWQFTEGLGLEKVVIIAKLAESQNGELQERVLHISNPGGHELVTRLDVQRDAPIRTLSEYQQKVVQLRRRGLVYPYEIIEMLTPPAESMRSPLPPGDFTEYDLNEDNQLVPVERPYGKNRSGLVVGVIRNYTRKYPEGMTRVLLLGDPSKNMGSLSEPECRRLIEAIALSKRLQVPIEWYTLSAGAKISMDSGTENMDWISRALKHIVQYTQDGGRFNIVVNGINVGGQPYWNSGAAIMMHTRGTLIMTPNGAMVLTGKQSLDYSGGVSAEDNSGIGGYERIMGPNGEAQYFAPDLSSACQLLMRYYDHTYVMPGERFPRRVATSDPIERDVREYPYVSTRSDDRDLTRVGDLFSEEKNAGRKHPFDMRRVMAALIDNDHQPLERWRDMRDAENAIVWDAHIGGYPVAMIGIESRPIPRRGFIPGDGPEQWTAGTLFPMSSKKIARALNSANGNRPVVVAANLSGFDGSPESMREMELEMGAEIGKAVANFEGPIIFCTVSRFHGGSFVVFSGALNDNVEVSAVEGSYASIIGGVPAAAVVFTRDVDTRAKADPRVKELQERLAQADNAQKAVLRAQLNSVMEQVRSEKVGEVASEFDHTHDILRAQRVGSVDYVIPASRLRPYLVEAIERGIAREMETLAVKK